MPAHPEERLPDPRRYVRDGRHPLLDLAASPGADVEKRLAAAFAELLDRREDAEVRKALALAPDHTVSSRLWRALQAASEGAGDGDEPLATAVFAIPLVIVSGARKSAALPGALEDVGALTAVLQQSGALGASRNFGLSNALCSLETLERVPPSTVRAWRVPGAMPRDITPEPIPIRAGEEVHLRFLLGAALTPTAAPSLAETAAHIGAWGMKLSRVLGAQMALPGVDLLTVPRPPAGVMKAACHGRRAQLDVALNLFLSNGIKRVRAAAGEPSLVISVHEGAGESAELRVSMSAALDDALLEGFRWPLHPLDDPDEIADGVRQFAIDCRVTDVREIGAVMPEGSGGEPMFLRAADAARLPSRH